MTTLAQTRRAAGLSQSDVARAMGVRQSRVSAIENAPLSTLTVGTLHAYLDAVAAPLRLTAQSADGDLVLHS